MHLKSFDCLVVLLDRIEGIHLEPSPVAAELKLGVWLEEN